MRKILTTFFYFIIYSFLGWIGEVTYAFAVVERFVNRGFLNGPFCPIYGFGALILVFFFKMHHESATRIFFISMAAAALVEYTTSYLLERLFNLKLWDYSYMTWQLNGRISLLTLILFGLSSIAIIKLIQPRLDSFLSSISTKKLTVFAGVFALYFAADFALTARALNQLDSIAANLDSLNSIKSKVLHEVYIDSEEKLYLSRIDSIQKRLIESFPEMSSQKHPQALEQIKHKLGH